MKSRLGASAVAALLLISATASAVSANSSRYHGTATFALPQGVVPNYIMPFAGGSVSNNVDYLQFSPLMWRPLYFFGHGLQVGIDYAESVGEAPIYSNGGKTVTINLNRKFTWSDGHPVTNRDVELWMNIFFAEKDNWLGYAAGSIPDDITSMSFPASNPYQFSLTFDKAYSHLWILYNQLSQIVPIPQQAWDRTSSSGPVGNYDTTTAGATAVYNFLNTQSQDVASYGTNPLWKTVDGPWHIQFFSAATGAATFVPNTNYTGPGRPKLAKFEEVPFTSDAAEFDALRSGQLDYGYLPVQDISQKAYFTSHGYQVANWVDYGFNDFFLNFTNPTVGPIFKQLYIRQAMQKLINQPQISSDIYHGEAYPTYGPIPTRPANPYTAKIGTTNPYPFSVSGAKKLLSSHGWTVHPNGIDSCAKPGSGAGECGTGVAKGAQLNFTEMVATGSQPFLAEVEAMQSAWSEAGIHVSLKQEPVGTIFGNLVSCSNGNEGCQWQMGNFGEIGSTPTYSPEYLPIGSQWFATGGGTNPQGYSNPHMDALINQAGISSNPAAIRAIGVYGAEQLPGLWQPNYPYQESVISKKLKGALPQNPNLNVLPQYWSLGS
ncbi:MAG TPA: ABC transporter substrate-binding protein [Candidatus Dormibacteraeota bacterium]